MTHPEQIDYSRKGYLTKKEFREFIKLQKKIFKKTNFVILDENNPEEIRYSKLLLKYNFGQMTKKKLRDIE